MDAQTAQIRHEIAPTRSAVDATSAPPEPPVPGPVRGVQEAAAWVAARLRRYPWWIIAAGVLVGYELLRAKTRPAGSVPTPSSRAAVTPPRERPPARARPTVYEAPQRPAGHAAAPPTPGEPTREAPPDPGTPGAR
jgi:hypothetical protein